MPWNHHERRDIQHGTLDGLAWMEQWAREFAAENLSRAVALNERFLHYYLFSARH